jgi:hypothetical protein
MGCGVQTSVHIDIQNKEKHLDELNEMEEFNVS